MRVQTPHDKFFKRFFGYKEITKDFLENYLPEDIKEIVDLDTINLEDGSHVDNELKETFSDMLFSVNINNQEGYIYFLFEHKSYGSRDISLQLLKYMIEIWTKDMEDKKLSSLPVIIPIVIYHGKTKWSIDEEFGNIIQGYDGLPEDIKEYIPNFKYLIYDLSSFTDEEIKGQVINKIILTSFKKIQNEDFEGMIKCVLDMGKYLNELEDKKRATEYFEILMKYVFGARADFTQKEAKKIIKEIENTYPEGSEIVMSLAERFIEEGIEKGMKKGMEKGEIKTMRKSIKSALFNRFNITSVEVNKLLDEIEDLSILENLFNKSFQVQSLEEFKSISENIIK